MNTTPEQQPEEPFTCPDCGYTAPRIGIISLHEPDCPNVIDDELDEYDYDGELDSEDES